MPLQMAEWRGRHMDPWRDSRVEVGKRWVGDYDKALQRLAETRVPEAVAALRGDALLPTQVITTLARAAHWSLAVAFYSEMARSCLEITVYHASAAVKACQQAGAWEPALALLEGAPSLTVQPNEYTYNAAISACEKRGHWQEAVAIFGLMAQRQCLLSVISFSAAMSACEKANRWQEALYLLHSMAGASVAKNTIAFSAAISACEKGGEWLLALELLTQMTLESVQRNTVTYCAAISACEKAAQWAAALQLFWEMPQRGVQRDEISFSAAISACEKSGQWESAVALLHTMSQVMPVSTVAASAAVTACEGQSQWQAALLLFSGTKVDQILANAAISAAEKGSQWQVAMQILGDFDRWRLQKTEITYTAAISSCEPAGIWHVALALFLEMRHALPAREQGVQAGSVLLALRRALGLAKAEELLERFRRLWEEEVPQVEQRRVAGFRVLGSGCGVLAIDKPQGVETEVVISELRAALQRPISCTSRLDLPTSGVLPVALGDEGSGATQYLRAQWAARLVSKQYLCLCVGEALPATRGEIRRGIRPVPGNLLMQEVSPYGRPARTAYQVLASYSHPENESTLSLVQVQLLTGRKHQIRVHFASIGRPLAGDRRYGGANDFWCERMFLHCRRLQVRDLRGRRLVVKSPLPAELAALLKRLEKKRLAHIARAARLDGWVPPRPVDGCEIRS
ncbi:unnamed protein product, partial [Effrenium voratum]